MPIFRTILCPTDLSPESDSALSTAARLARDDDATLVALNCRRTEAGAAAPTAHLFDESLAGNAGLGSGELPRWEGLVASGESVPETIVREAATRGVDLIVMRSRRRPVAAALLGSTAEAVCRTAPCPVLVTHPSDDDGRADTERPRRMLVAYDFWDDSELALRYGLALAARNGAELHLLHVVPAPDRGAPEASWEGKLGVIGRRLAGAVSDDARRSVRITSHVRAGQPYREILTFAEDYDVDLVAMGARGRDFGARSLFGSNSDRVLRQARCPILIVRPLRPAVAESAYLAGSRVDPIATAIGSER